MHSHNNLQVVSLRSVLILVLMEDALAQVAICGSTSICGSLNPCFNGRCTRTMAVRKEERIYNEWS